MDEETARKHMENWPAGREVHLMGGCRAINIPGPRVEIFPQVIAGKTAGFSLRNYYEIFKSLERINLQPIGVDFVSNIFILEGRAPPNWRVFLAGRDGIWRAHEAGEKWGQLANTGRFDKLGHLSDLASRLRHQMRVCDLRVRHVSELYYEQLRARVASKAEVKAGSRFSDGFTWQVYLGIQTYLIDACIMRDYLVEFAAHFVLKPLEPLKARVRSAGELKRKLDRKAFHDDPIATEFLAMMSDAGWLKRLGEYRDLVVHWAPLEYADRRPFARYELYCIDADNDLPGIICPIPENPFDISQARRSNRAFDDYAKLYEGFMEQTREGRGIDGLSYVHETQGCIADLSLKLIARAPVRLSPFAAMFTDLNSRSSLTTKGGRL